jgi:hypothetical protein
MNPKNGSKETDEMCCSTLILATAGPTFSMARVIAVSLDPEISLPVRKFKKKNITNRVDGLFIINLDQD